MLSGYKGEDQSTVRTSVKYLSPQEREAYKVSVQDGRVFDSTGKPFETRNAPTEWGSDRRAAIFVMDKKKNLYLSNSLNSATLKHSSFLAGGPVASAGEMQIEDGYVKSVSNRSGHYVPTGKHLERVAQELEKKGAAPADRDYVEPHNP